jgi:hypothetical protein
MGNPYDSVVRKNADGTCSLLPLESESMKKPDVKTLSDAARQQANTLIASYTLDGARIIAKHVVDILEAKSTDLAKKYGR